MARKFHIGHAALTLHGQIPNFGANVSKHNQLQHLLHIILAYLCQKQTWLQNACICHTSKYLKKKKHIQNMYNHNCIG